MADLTHLDEQGDARMVDVSGKRPTVRKAVARAVVVMPTAVADAFFGGNLPKGDARAVVRIAAIQAAKKTPDLVPLCHPLPLDAVEVDVGRTRDGAAITATVTTTARTGVEMEAMTAVSVGALACYDMVKGLDKGVRIERVELLHKTGGASGDWSA
jgi:cyclic pyranopterin phosphate synthase